MYHTLEVYHEHLTDTVSQVTFNTKDILYLYISHKDGEPTRATIGLNYFNDDGDQSYYCFNSFTNKREKDIVEQLAELSSNLAQVSAYYIDSDGTVIAYSKVMLTEPSTYTIVLDGNVKIRLKDNADYEDFVAGFCNYMDVSK